MRALLTLAFLWALLAPALARQECYTHELNHEVTITVDEREMVLHQPGKDTPMRMMGAGTGLPLTSAREEDGTSHLLRFLDGDLLFDMDLYEHGCPLDRTWVDRECERVLISQASPHSDYVSFYYLEPGQPITDCAATSPFPSTRFNELKCSSGRVLKVDADDYDFIIVDGIEMPAFSGPLPCRPDMRP